MRRSHCPTPSAGSIIFSTYLACLSKSKASRCSQASLMLTKKAVAPRKELWRRWPKLKLPRIRKPRRLLEATRPLRKAKAVNRSSNRNNRRESQQRSQRVVPQLHRTKLQLLPPHPKRRKRSNHKRNRSRNNSRSLKSQRPLLHLSSLTSLKWISVLARLSSAGTILTVKSSSV